MGCWSEGNDYGAWLNNISYGNGAGGFGILETGFANIDGYEYNDADDGGMVRFEGNVVVDNPRGIEFRFCLRTPSNHQGGPVIMKNNVFKGWSTVAWGFGDPFTQNDVTVADAGWVIEGNIYDNSNNADVLAEWTHSPCTVEDGYGYGGAKHCDVSVQNRTPCASIGKMRDDLDIEHEGSTETFEFRGPVHPVQNTSQVGIIPSQDAETNHIRTKLEEYAIEAQMGTGEASVGALPDATPFSRAAPRVMSLAERRLALANLAPASLVTIYAINGRPVAAGLRPNAGGVVRVPQISAGAYVARIHAGGDQRQAEVLNFVVSR
ncbi:MAG: hypothetical protein GF418_08925 [Chitinivibrionales bacterium]|nr:hypothetical protein [Chitinivibrionales bacterium]MBD3395736.1 hypothetical protein [Chitinivibrionales bacterium]